MLPYQSWLPPLSNKSRSLLAPPTSQPEPPSSELQSLNAERLEEDRLAVNGLATTSLLSVAVGALGALRAERTRSRAFHLTSTAVHLFALGTAVAGRAAIEAQDPARLGPEDSVQRGARLLKLLKAGIASDVGAMAAGALALGAGRRKRHAVLAGAGTSLLLHGAMLLLFDTGLLLHNTSKQPKLPTITTRSPV